MKELTIEEIRMAMRGPLPGLAAQITMAPSLRPFHPPDGPEPRQAGVLLLLYPIQGQLHLVFTVRPANLEYHAGQVSFPGGGKEEGDRTLMEAALRETREELGVSTDEVEILGPLTPLYVPPSHNYVHPFVAYNPRRPLFRPDPLEVAGLLEVPLVAFLDPTIRREDRVELEGMEVIIPYYAIGDYKIWGATAIILAEFLAMITSVILTATKPL
jgi:8-oxo-dGTP pyrophosphatase MutT (NUDIX family)